MKIVRIFSFILAVLMLATSLVSCDLFKQDEPPVEDPVDTEKPAEPEVTELSIVNKGITEYVIVRDYQASKSVVDTVANIAAMIKEHTGADIQVKECFNNLENEPLDVETEKEILVGMTNRKESEEALKGLLADDYTMQIKGSKLVIGGGGDSGTVKALTVFLTAYIYEQGNKFMVKNGEMQSLKFTKEDNVVSRGIYSYSKCQMLGVRIDSFLLAYPKNSEMSQTCKKFAEDLQAHIAKESGYELEIDKDTRAWGDYEILIGDTKRTDAGLYEELGKDEYYIKLVKKQVTYEDGSVHDGGTMYVCFGKDAEEAAKAALLAFTKQVMPASTKPLEFSLEENFVLTNKK